MTFKKWLQLFKDVDYPIGDLANDVAQDSNFPNSFQNLDELTDYLYRKNAVNEAIQTAKNAYIYYSLDENLASYIDGELVWRSKN